MATCSIGTLITQACESNFKCLDDQQYRAVLLQLLCNLSAAGGSNGFAQSFAGDGAPTTQIPAYGAGSYYDYTGTILYHWNPTLNGGAGGWE